MTRASKYVRLHATGRLLAEGAYQPQGRLFARPKDSVAAPPQCICGSIALLGSGNHTPYGCCALSAVRSAPGMQFEGLVVIVTLRHEHSSLMGLPWQVLACA